MFTFVRPFIRQLRVLFSRTLELPKHLLQHPVQMTAGPEGLIIRAQRGGFAAQYRETTPRPACELVTSFALLKQVEGKSDSVTFIASVDGPIIARWQDGPIPRVLSEPPPTVDPSEVFPPAPNDWSENTPQLWSALAAAQGTTAPKASRYALGCIQLCGKAGVVAATDGCQLLRQANFQLGWDDDVLIPGSQLFAARDLPLDQPVAMSRLDKSVVLRVGKWTFWLPIQEGRYPRVDDVVPAPSSTSTTLYLPPAQQEFLKENLPRLKCDSPYEPVTIDLNGRVVFRCRESSTAPATELVLRHASHTGPDICIVSNRRYLQRALDLGFSEFCLTNSHAAIVCREPHREFAWAAVAPESAVKAMTDTVSIESPDTVMLTHPRRRRGRHSVSASIHDANSIAFSEDSLVMPRANSQTTAATSGKSPAGRCRGARHSAKVSLIEQAQAVHAKLRELTVETNKLLWVAKRQRQ